jgi:hypothetical protein
MLARGEFYIRVLYLLCSQSRVLDQMKNFKAFDFSGNAFLTSYVYIYDK